MSAAQRGGSAGRIPPPANGQYDTEHDDGDERNRVYRWRNGNESRGSVMT